MVRAAQLDLSLGPVLPSLISRDSQQEREALYRINTGLHQLQVITHCEPNAKHVDPVKRPRTRYPAQRGEYDEGD